MNEWCKLYSNNEALTAKGHIIIVRGGLDSLNLANIVSLYLVTQIRDRRMGRIVSTETWTASCTKSGI
jgi:hypothetical protein